MTATWNVHNVVPFGAFAEGSSGQMLNQLLLEFHNENADIILYNALLRSNDYSKPWVGFAHWTAERERDKNIDMSNCQRLFTFSEQNKVKLEEMLGVPVTACPLPTKLDVPKWTWAYGDIVTCGRHFRNRPLAQKYANVVLGHNREERIPTEEYNELLTSSIVLECYEECVGSTVLCECISRGVPLITNRLPAIEEYLTSEYPLFYEEDPREVLDRIASIDLRAVSDLLLSRRWHVSPEKFRRCLLLRQ